MAADIIKEDINNYTFDFAEEVQRLINEMGPKAANILFANMSVRHDGTRLGAVFHQLMGGKNVTEEYAREAGQYAANRICEDPTRSSFAVQSDSETDFSAIIFNQGTFTKNFFGPEYADLSSLFTLYHEAGHILLPEGDEPDELHPYKECAADAYLALRFLQRFGSDAIPFLSMKSWMRSFAAFSGDTKHLSTAVLDKIIADSTTHDFTTYSHEKIVECAREYADQWTPTPEALSAARPFFLRKVKKIRSLLAGTCLSSSSHDLAFLVGAKVAQPFLQTGIIYQGKRKYFTKKKRAEYESSIAARLDSMNIDELFNNSAVRPALKPKHIARALQVILPSNRKWLVFNPR